MMWRLASAGAGDGPPMTTREHDDRWRDVHDAIVSARLTGPHGAIEGGFRIPVAWDYEDPSPQWKGILYHPYDNEIGRHRELPLGTADSGVPARLMQEMGRPETMRFLRETRVHG